MTRTPTDAALTALVLLQSVMLAALFAKVPPHPPEAIPLFGIAPFLAMAISTAAASLSMGSEKSPSGTVLAVAAAFMALLSFGPQKYMDAQFPLIWPAVIAAQIAAVTIFVRVFQNRRDHRLTA